MIDILPCKQGGMDLTWNQLDILPCKLVLPFGKFDFGNNFGVPIDHQNSKPSVMITIIITVITVKGR